MSLYNIIDVLKKIPFYSFFLRTRNKLFMNRMFKYYKDSADSEICELLNNIRKQDEIRIFNYPFVNKYNNRNVNIVFDESCGMYYVIDEYSGNKKMYFPREFTDKSLLLDYYTRVCYEQDINSPHKYLSSEFCIKEGDVVVDAGVAEGNFGLSIIEKCSKLYMFECDSGWCEALEQTFKPWKEKVVIIKKYLGNKSECDFTKLDDFFTNEIVNFIKMDIEGAEIEALEGATLTLKNQKKLKLAICAYHNQSDEIKIRKFFNSENYEITFSHGYMCNIDRIDFKKPYIRRGVLRIKSK